MTEPSPERIGPYRVLSELGRGGMGVVYRARRDDLDHEVALKIVVPGAGSEHDGEAFTRLQREARAAAQLADIPGIVGVHDVGAHEGQIYLAMDLIEGRSLDAVLAEDDWTLEQVADSITQVAEALHQAHERGLLHRDVKPANVMLDRDGRAYLTDFGLAKWTAAEGELSRLTVSGAIMGTPAYMAPEQARGESLDARADVYALGVTLYEALAGRPPFEGDTMLAVLNLVLREPPRPLHLARPGIPRPLSAIVHRAMAKAPADRYASAGALAADLRRFVAGDAVEARLPGVLARFGGAARRRRFALAAVSLLAVAGIATAIILPRLRAKDAGQTEQLHASAEATAELNRLGSALAAYRELVRRTLPQLQRLEDGWRHVQVTPNAQADALATIDAVVDEVATAHPGTRGPNAWRALAHGFANDVDALTTLREMGRSPSDDPIPALLLSQVLLARYGAEARLPDVAMSTGEQVIGKYHESAAQREWRTQALAALRLVEGLPGWGDLEEAERYARLARGAEALAGGRHTAAAAEFARLVDDPLLGATAADLQGLALFSAGRYGASAVAWERAAERGWPAALVNAANAWVSEGVARGLNDAPEAEPYERAIALLNRAKGLTDQQAQVLRARASARMFLGLALPRLDGADPAAVDAAFSAGVDDLRAAVVLLDSATTRAALGQGLLQLSQHRARHGRDPRPLLDEAAATLTRALESSDAHWVARLNRATVYRRQADLLGRHGDADPLFERCLTDLRVLATGTAPPYPVWLELGFTHLARGRIQMRFSTTDPSASLRAAIAACGKALEARPGAVQALQTRAGASEALGRWDARQGGDPARHFSAADADLTQAIERAPGEPSLWRDRGVVRYRRSGEGREVEERIGWIEKSRADYEQAWQRGMRQSGILLNIANTWMSEGHTLRQVARDPAPAWETAEAKYSEALQLNARDGRLWQMRAKLRQIHGGYRQTRGEPWEDFARAALADYDKAIELIPRSAEAWGDRARLLAGLRRFAEAERSAEQAVRLSGGARPWAALLAAVRRDLAAKK